VLFSWCAALAWCQKPVIFSGGVVNAASYAQDMTRNSIGTIFGANLATSTQTAAAIPLPTTLAGTSVIGCSALHLFYVSPSQINFQWPQGSCPSPPAGIVVSTAAGTSDPYVFPSPPGNAPGLFTRDSSGCGQGAVLNVRADGSVSVNSPQNSVSPGEFISVYGTGLGNYYGMPPDGTPTPMSPLIMSGNGGHLALDFVGYPITNLYTDFWVGLAPGLIAVDQYNYRVPDAVREGCAVPLQASSYNGVSQPVTVSIRRGGGPCVDPPSAGYGQITWEKTVVIQPPSSSSETSDTLTVSLQASPGKSLPAPVGNPSAWFGPSCPVPGYRSLDAGAVTIQGPGFGSVQAPLAPLQEGQVSGLSTYRAALPAGAIQPGPFSVRASGGADVGAFQSGVNIGSEIHITTALAGRVLHILGPGLTIAWTGGDSSELVTAWFVMHYGYADSSSYSASAPASAGTLGLSPMVSNREGAAELIVQVTPAAPQALTFPGLSLGGQHLWKYTYRYQGISLTYP
jgi:uncharacterized protein (TIGR03437 family)